MREPTRVVRGEIAGSRWELASRRPAPALRPHVLRLVGYDEQSNGPRSQRQFPAPLIVLIIEIDDPLRVMPGGDPGAAARHPGGFLAGLGGRFAITEHAGRQRGVQVDLTPTGARRLLGIPMSEIADRVVGLRDLDPDGHRSLAEKLAELPDWASRLDRVEWLLAHRIAASAIDTRRVDFARARIEASGGRLPVAALSRELGVSPRHLIALFRDQVGVPPKLLARLVRFDRLMRAVAQGRAQRFVELALEHGYFDQAHLARDVREFTGLTPTRARAEIPDLQGLLT